jgi:lipid A ethanolaminephosphotransferase
VTPIAPFRPVPPGRAGWSANTVTAVAALVFTVLYSVSFWRVVLDAQPPAGLPGQLFVLATGVVVWGFNGLVLSLLAWRGVHKPLLALVFLLAAAAAAFMDGYGAVIDRHALQSVLETDAREAADWFSWRLVAYIVGLGVVPALLLWRVPVRYARWPRELLHRAAFVAAALVAIGLAVLPFSREMASLARNHGELRHLAVPANLFNATRGYLKHRGMAPEGPVRPLALDVHPGSRAKRRPRVLVVVVGESARAASFSLGGYGRPTNPELAKLPLTWFADVSSCGTNTATSVPCMFSGFGRRDYDESVARRTENLFDVVARGGFRVEWEDNNTGSKGVAARLTEEDVGELATGCAPDCYDEVLVEHLRAELDALPAGIDEVFVLHQIGSHGPAYFRRVPPAFQAFQPACLSVDLQRCTREQIVNSYDNTILYTDHVLAALIGELQRRTDRDTALLYVSDHGESTGENGWYLHGAPYVLAPAEQTRVPMLLWTSAGFRDWRALDAGCTAAAARRPLSHDNVFHLVLGLLDLQTQAYRPALDPFGECAPA